LNNKQITFTKEIFQYLLSSLAGGLALFGLLFLSNSVLYEKVVSPHLEERVFSEAVSEFQKFVNEQKADSHGRITWQAADGTVFYLRNDSQLMDMPKFHNDINQPLDQRQPLGVEKSALITYGSNKIRTIFLVIENRWPLYIGIVVSLLISLLLGALLFYWQLLRKVKYMREIEKGTIILESGNLTHRIPERGQDELTKIAISLNEMSQSLSEKIVSEEKATQASREVISDLSHDIRTPLTILSGYLPTLLETDLSEEQRKYLELIYKKTQQMNIRVNDLLEYATIFSGQRTLDLQTLPAHVLLEQFITELLPLTEITYQIQVPETALVVGDAKLLERLFDNLLSNLNQHADLTAGVTIDVTSSEKQLHLTMKNKIATNDTSTGKSLGVKIATMIVELHNGQMFHSQDKQTYQTEIYLPIR
jgi:signal transduction histidine kinase